jgi:glycosyltransferase involved in cell wall biosynthesis
MGVPRNFYRKPAKKNFTPPLRIGFVGGFYSNGIDQGIFRLIDQVREINSREGFVLATLTILGVEVNLLEELNSKYMEMLHEGELKLFPRGSQSFILEKAADFDVGILPYPGGKFFANRFPLKVMEYAALGKPIIVSVTEGHENILTREEAWFYDIPNIESLRKCIIDICSNSELVFSRQERAFEKSRLFTYENRVNRILEVLFPK